MPLTYLALGDSYTIGEAVPLLHSFPYQTVHLLRRQGFEVAAPEVVAATGWATGELIEAVNDYPFLPQYDFVTLLIGVNNQYRGLPLAAYKKEFEQLLQRALSFAGNKSSQVFVLSIPDYGITPFAQQRQPKQIAKEIDDFNDGAKRLCEQCRVLFMDITTGWRAAATDNTLIAQDGLHPSRREYYRWAKKLSEAISEIVLKNAH